MHNRQHWISGFRRLLRPFRSAVNAIFAKLQDRLLLHCFPISFKVLEFRLFDSSDSRDERWEEWSRVYEYEFILEKVKNLSKTAQISIHNTCWGYQGIHLKFKDELESKYSQVTNSDMLSSALPNTQVYDLRKSPEASIADQSYYQWYDMKGKLIFEKLCINNNKMNCGLI